MKNEHETTQTNQSTNQPTESTLKEMETMVKNETTQKQSNIVNVSLETNEKNVFIPYETTIENGNMPFDFFEKYAIDNPNQKNVVITFDTKKSFQRIGGIGFTLKRTPKTLGTYVTRCNKIAAGLNPNETQKRTFQRTTTKKSNTAIFEYQPNVFVLFEMKNQNMQTIIDKNNGTIKSNCFEKHAYFIQPFFEISKNNYFNRFEKLVETIYNHETQTITICSDPEYILSFGNIETIVGNGNEPTNDEIKNACNEILQQHIENGNYDVNIKQLFETKPILIGGGDSWLMETLEKYIETHDNKNDNKNNQPKPTNPKTQPEPFVISINPKIEHEKQTNTEKIEHTKNEIENGMTAEKIVEKTIVKNIENHFNKKIDEKNESIVNEKNKKIEKRNESIEKRNSKK